MPGVQIPLPRLTSQRIGQGVARKQRESLPIPAGLDTQSQAAIPCNLLAGIVVCGVARPSQDPAPAALRLKANDPAPLGGLAVTGEANTEQPLGKGWHPQQLPPDIADGINHTARGQKPCVGFARLVPPMDTITRWANAQQAAKALGLSATRLRQLQAAKKLVAGQHWVYLTGTAGGPVGWDVDAIAEWQREQTAAIAKRREDNAAAIETYQEGN